MDDTPNDPLRIWFDDFKVLHRVVLMRGDADLPWPEVPPDGIVSRVPAVRVDLPPKGSSGRRRILRMPGSGSWVWMWGRVRPAPEGKEGHDLSTLAALDRRGNTVPAALIDRCCLTVHVLLDVATARPFLAASEEGFLPRLADAVLGQSIASILSRGGGEAIVGPGIAQTIGVFLSSRPAAEETRVRSERSFVQRFVQECASLPESLAERIASMSASLGELTERGSAAVPPRELIDSEVSSLRRLVEKRTLAGLRFNGAEIVATANPAPEASRRGRGGVQFRVFLEAPGGRPRLFLGPPTADMASCRRPVCLGCGEEALARLARDGDLYGMIDFVLAFLDTNGVAALPPVPPRVYPAEERLAEALEGLRDAHA